MIWVFSSCRWSGLTKQTTDPSVKDKKRKHIPFFLIQTDTHTHGSLPDWIYDFFHQLHFSLLFAHITSLYSRITHFIHLISCHIDHPVSHLFIPSAFYPSIHPSIHLSSSAIHVLDYLSIHPSFHPSISFYNPSIHHLSTQHPSVNLPVHPFTTVKKKYFQDLLSHFLFFYFVKST